MCESDEMGLAFIIISYQFYFYPLSVSIQKQKNAQIFMLNFSSVLIGEYRSLAIQILHTKKKPNFFVVDNSTDFTTTLVQSVSQSGTNIIVPSTMKITSISVSLV